MSFSDRLLQPVTEHSQRWSAVLVREGGERGAKKLLRYAGLRFVVWVAFLVGIDFVPDLVQTLMLAVAGGYFLMYVHGKAFAYRNGWMQGRIHAVQQAAAHVDQETEEFNAGAWVESVKTYDLVHVVGLGVRVPDSLDGYEKGDGET